MAMRKVAVSFFRRDKVDITIPLHNLVGAEGVGVSFSFEKRIACQHLLVVSTLALILWVAFAFFLFFFILALILDFSISSL